MSPNTAERSHTASQAPAYRMATMLIGMGVTHFAAPKLFDTIVPDELPGDARLRGR